MRTRGEMFALWMQDRRHEMGFTQEQLAEKLRQKGHTSMSQAAVSQMEKLRRSISLDEAFSIAEVLNEGYRPRELLGAEEIKDLEDAAAELGIDIRAIRQP